MLVSEQQAITASKQAYVEMLQPLAKQGKVDNNPAVTKRVQTMTDRLIVEAIKMRPETRQWEWSVKVIDDPEMVNAWCMAGAAVAAKLAVELHNSRTSEAEADRMGIELAAKAGYDPHAAVTLWQKMNKLGESRAPEFLSTHPAPENREKTLQALIPQMMPYYEQAKARYQ
jgi:predicted Zn-dependent protease